MTYYCYLDSKGDLESKNLQLDNLTRAAKEWNDEVIELVNSCGEKRVNSVYKQGLAFIVTSLGQSLTQLLGQNAPTTGKTRIDSPAVLFKKLISNKSKNIKNYQNLENTFFEFLSYYNATRHFGKLYHRKIDQLTVKKLEEFINMTIEIWDNVIADRNHDCTELKSITDIVPFRKLA